MAAPTPSSRVFPAGIKLEDGYQSLITFAYDTDVSFWEKTIKPPGIDGGDPVDTTTMHNADWRTKSARHLMEMTESTVKAGYDPALWTQALALVNRETTITITYPDGSTLAFYGFLQKLEKDDLAEGTFPEATLTIIPTNEDPSTGTEEAPVYTNVSGT